MGDEGSGLSIIYGNMQWWQSDCYSDSSVLASAARRRILRERPRRPAADGLHTLYSFDARAPRLPAAVWTSQITPRYLPKRAQRFFAKRSGKRSGQRSGQRSQNGLTIRGRLNDRSVVFVGRH